MSRLPIRARLTVAFALAMAVVLVAVGAFLYFRLGSSLDEAIDESLQARASEATAQITVGEDVVSGGDPEERLFQLLDESGQLVAGTSETLGPLLGPAKLAAVQEGTRWFVLDGLEGVDGSMRVLATPVETSIGATTLLVGSSLEDRNDALRQLLTLLFVGGPVALLFASLLGYGLATLALRPVESMRAEAAAISASEPGRRLPLPEADDEISRLGETLNSMLDELEAALERERGFVADASHELRTPIALLKTELELALRRPRSEAELDDVLRSAAAEADRLAQLADHLLLLARSDEGKLALNIARVSAQELLSGVATRFARRADEADRTIEVTVPEALELEGDAPRLEQALGNLVENALIHSHRQVHLSAERGNGRIDLHVQDDGRGFPPDFLIRAFDRFSRPDDARSGGGTGLGLAIADAIARAHGGAAHAGNREGGGADVWLSLPTA